ncbi:MAG: 2-dehydro-3-deoxyphosphogluconate aldolase [spirochete symbiont of Stewartia floridana]|nr:MAG: 2-dehydro-3-deoxyphosphogluconate aldolase [spirochete symbiont of Stewartia floridana]
MFTGQIEQRLASLRIIPVVTIDDPRSALPLGKALIDGGLPVCEITFRTEAAFESIKMISAELPEILIGAGTVLTAEQADNAITAGAAFIVSPGFNPHVVDYCLERGYCVFPGVNSPTQVEMGLERGLRTLKFFPAEISGGIAMLKALAAPYGDVRFLPTGGIDAANVARYLALRTVIACGGSWMVKPPLIAEGQFDQIRRLTHEAVAAASGLPA